MTQHSRLQKLWTVFVCALGIILVRAAWIQLIPNSRLESFSKRQFGTVLSIAQRRGEILDRSGNELATSVGSWSLFSDPARIKDPYTTASRLAELLYLPRTRAERIRLAKTLVPKLRGSGRRFVWIERQLDRKTKDRIERAEIKGIGFIEEPKRIYPNGRLAAPILGFIGKEGKGLEGLEYKFNSVLQGNTKKLSVARDARGRPLVVSGQMLSAVGSGTQVQLTLDRDLQYVLEDELSAAVQANDADSGMAVVLDAKTSEILAMATVAGSDLRSMGGTSSAARTLRNKVVTDMFEPGSTMKTFVIAEAIQQGKIEPNTKVFAENGVMQIGTRKIREADAEHSFGWITVTEVLAQSSNIGAFKIAQMLGDAQLRAAYLRFGFGDRFGLELPGEAMGLVSPLPWHDHLLANASFGHGIATSVLQLANAYAVIANGGVLKKPYIVQKITDGESGEVQQFQEQTLRRVISEDAARKMRLVLTAATQESATGAKARVIGFPVAGKTGTAQRVLENGRGYESGAYISSFSGFIPANDPKFVISVSIDRPKKQYYGSAVAAPVFSKVAGFAVRRAGLSPVVLTAHNVLSRDRFEKPVTASAAATPAPSRDVASETSGQLDLQSFDLSGLTLREALEESMKRTGTWTAVSLGQTKKKDLGRIKLQVPNGDADQSVRLYMDDARSL